MAKRFIDTEIFDDSWFMDLSQEGKLLWIYCITKCNHAGILQLNKKLVTFQTGIDSLETVIKELGNCLVSLREDLYFIPKFIKFQYPNFPKSNVKQQESAIKLLEEFKSTLTVKQLLDKYYGNGNVNGNEDDNGNVKETKKQLSYPRD